MTTDSPDNNTPAPPSEDVVAESTLSADSKASAPAPVAADEETSSDTTAKKKTTRKKVARKTKATAKKKTSRKKAASKKAATSDADDGKAVKAEKKAPDTTTPKEKEADVEEVEAKAEEPTEKPKDQEKPEPKPEKKLPPVPDFIDLNELHKRPLSALHAMAVEAELRIAGIRSKHQLIFELLSYYGRRGTKIEAEGVLEREGNGHGFLRWRKFSFAPLADDVYLPQNLLRQKKFQPGLLIRCEIRTPRDREKFFTVKTIQSVEGIPYEEWQAPTPFENLTALFPRERLILETKDKSSVTSRIVDLVAPLGKGQRGLVVAPPRGGKTLLLKDIARSIRGNYPELELIVLLLDERPEEVTDFKETVDTDIYSSTFDESPKRHIQVAELVMERAKRLVELGKDVVILLDSLTRLARGYNQTQGSGPTMSGGIGAKSLIKPRKFFSAARNCEEGGSLTVIATALVETENRMDEIIFEEFKGSGNLEIALDRDLVERRVFPAINVPKSGTRNDDRLYHPDEFKRITIMRRELAQLPAVETIEYLSKNIHLTGNNAEMLLKGLQ